MVETDSEGRRLYKARGPDGEETWVDHDELWRLQQLQAQELRRQRATRRRRLLMALAVLVAVALALVLARLRWTGEPPPAGRPTAAAPAAAAREPGDPAPVPVGQQAAGDATAPPVAAPLAARGERERIAAAVGRWVDAWARRDVAAYLASYGGGFTPAGGVSRPSWERQRRRRLEAPAWIRVEIEELEIALAEGGRAEARFRQSYRSPLYADVVRKSLELVEEAGEWRIVAERAEPLAPAR